MYFHMQLITYPRPAWLLDWVAKYGPIFYNFRMSDSECAKCMKYEHSISFVELFSTHNLHHLWAGKDYTEKLIEPENLDRLRSIDVPSPNTIVQPTSVVS